MERYTYEFEAYLAEKYWIVIPHGLEGATQGIDFEDAVDMAADWLRIKAEDAAIYGYEMPDPVFGAPLEHGGQRIVVSVVAGRDTIKAVTAKRAAEILGVPKKRIAKMRKKALLEGWDEGKKTYITLDSVIARLEDGQRK